MPEIPEILNLNVNATKNPLGRDRGRRAEDEEKRKKQSCGSEKSKETNAESRSASRGQCAPTDYYKACEYLEQKNRKLKKEVDSLSEEQRLLSEALCSHEAFCPIMHCSFSLQQDNSASLSH